MVDPDILKAQKLLDHIKDKCKYASFHIAQIYQKGPGSIRSATEAKRILKILEKHHCIKLIEGGAIFDGKRRRSAWEACYEV